MSLFEGWSRVHAYYKRFFYPLVPQTANFLASNRVVAVDDVDWPLMRV